MRKRSAPRGARRHKGNKKAFVPSRGASASRVNGGKIGKNKSMEEFSLDAVHSRILKEHGFNTEFGVRVQREAAALENERWQLGARQDFTDEFIITIDGEDAKDLDDAVSLCRVDGQLRLGVHIADVAHYVKEGSSLDKEAFNRGTSVYFGDSVVPMLPKELSNGLCSLHPHTDKLTLSLIMMMDEQGNVTNSQLCEGVINTKHRLSYEFVQNVLDGNQQCEPQLAHMLREMQALAKKLVAQRERNGSVDFDLAESKVSIENGMVVDVAVQKRLFAHRIIEEFMLVANRTVAQKFYKNSPFVFRVHDLPDAQKLQHLQEFIAPLGLKLKQGKDGSITPKAVSNLLKDATKTNYFNAVGRVALRSMAKAVYHDKCAPHFGLGFKHYCHFTSPIRRYPDLAIHRIIKNWLKNKELKRFKGFCEAASKQSSEREREAMSVEREIDAVYKADYMSRRIGEELEAQVSGVMDFGVFAELENTIEGLIFRENLPNDFYVLDQKNMCLRGRKHSFKIGDKIRVRVLRASPNIGKIEFVHVSEDGQESDALPRVRKRGAISQEEKGASGAKKGKSAKALRKDEHKDNKIEQALPRARDRQGVRKKPVGIK